jgi:hypothetical protein
LHSTSEQTNDEHIDAQRKAHRAKRAEIADALILGQMERAVELLRAVVA